uniref:Uncharacterized protein n=1 Tax=Anguilla anguilla TaxID=7936 RepID=A0A0E9Q366_ANGAN
MFLSISQHVLLLEAPWYTTSGEFLYSVFCGSFDFLLLDTS